MRCLHDALTIRPQSQLMPLGDSGIEIINNKSMDTSASGHILPCSSLVSAELCGTALDPSMSPQIFPPEGQSLGNFSVSTCVTLMGFFLTQELNTKQAQCLKKLAEEQKFQHMHSY